ncbi:MAG TPA: hypothetical protein VGN59_18335 [Acidimicrobiia bacterium]
MASNLQTTWTETELLEGDPVAEPLVLAGYRCHGGFDADGTYRSPRTRFRAPAIDDWQRSHAEQFGTELLDVPLERWPASYPTVSQSRYLLEQGVREPVVMALTRIGTVEGFGAMIRHAAVPDRQQFFADSIAGTAIEHLDRGLFEAHARDEAGWDEEAGHRHMWFAVRDLAFEHPVTEDQTEEMLQRMGIGSGGPAPTPAEARARMLAARQLDDVDPALEAMIRRMIGILLIEISAHHVFAWAEELLADADLVAGDGDAARLVSYIRQDEAPHVAYLATALTEMRDRTFVGESGRRIPGTEVIGPLWASGLEESLGAGREQNRRLRIREVEQALDGHGRRDEILEGFHALGDHAQSEDPRPTRERT